MQAYRRDADCRRCLQEVAKVDVKGYALCEHESALVNVTYESFRMLDDLTSKLAQQKVVCDAETWILEVEPRRASSLVLGLLLYCCVMCHQLPIFLL